MMNELDALEDKVAQIVTLCRDLRTENADLRQRLATAEMSRAALLERMETARSHIEQLAAQLPRALEDEDLA